MVSLQCVAHPSKSASPTSAAYLFILACITPPPLLPLCRAPIAAVQRLSVSAQCHKPPTGTHMAERRSCELAPKAALCPAGTSAPPRTWTDTRPSPPRATHSASATPHHTLQQQHAHEPTGPAASGCLQQAELRTSRRETHADTHKRTHPSLPPKRKKGSKQARNEHTGIVVLIVGTRRGGNACGAAPSVIGGVSHSLLCAARECQQLVQFALCIVHLQEGTVNAMIPTPHDISQALTVQLQKART